MNKIKQLLIIPYLLTLFFILVHSIYHLITQAFSLAWLSVIIACGPMLGFMVYLGIGGTPRTSRHLPIQVIAASVGAAIVLINFEWLPAFYTLIFGFAGVMAYVFWYSDLGRDDSPVLALGNILPEFAFLADSGATLHSSGYLGSPSIYLFYRGSWCPLCVAQIREISEQYQQLQAMGVNVILMSPQGQQDTKSLAKKFHVPFIFGFDKDNAVAKLLGIAHRDGIPPGLSGDSGADTVFPTVIITDEKNKIIWTDQTDNYRVRPEPATFLAVLKNYRKEDTFSASQQSSRVQPGG